MKEFLKKNRLSLAVIVVIALGAVNLYLYKSSAKLSEINSQLEMENYKLNLDIQKSEVRENRFRSEIKSKTITIKQLDTELDKAIAVQKSLKKRVADLCKPKDPKTFKKLDDCKQSYTELVKDFELSLAANRESEFSLKLCLDKSSKQEEVIDIQEKAYLECREQGKLKNLKLQKTEEAMNRLDRYYKRKLMQKSFAKYTIGIIAGILAGYFMFKKR